MWWSNLQVATNIITTTLHQIKIGMHSYAVFVVRASVFCVFSSSAGESWSCSEWQGLEDGVKGERIGSARSRDLSSRSNSPLHRSVSPKGGNRSRAHTPRNAPESAHLLLRRRGSRIKESKQKKENYDREYYQGVVTKRSASSY